MSRSIAEGRGVLVRSRSRTLIIAKRRQWPMIVREVYGFQRGGGAAPPCFSFLAEVVCFGQDGGVMFWILFGLLSVVAVVPFWVTRLLPMQDYPQFLLFVRAFADYRDVGSPFFGTYSVGFPLSPLLAPLVLTRGIAAFTTVEVAGKVLWSLYALGLPFSSLYLLSVLRRDRWCVFLVFPLVYSYWVIGGFVSFATGAPLLILGLAFGVRWLETRRVWFGVGLGLVASVLWLWHALMWAQVVFDFGLLWLFWRGEGWRARFRAVLPVLPSALLFLLWLFSTVQGRTPGRQVTAWPSFFDNLRLFFEYVGPIVPEAAGGVVLLGVLLLAGGLFPSRRGGWVGLFCVENPFGWLAFVAVICFVVFPASCFGVEGIHNRQPWLAALLFVFGWNLPSGRVVRGLLLSSVFGAGVFVLGHFVLRFRAFDRETAGASRLMDTLPPRSTMLAPFREGMVRSFPGKPLVGLYLYSSIRHGGLPDSSFAGYNINFIRYTNDKNPMPGLGMAQVHQPRVNRIDYVLVSQATMADLGRVSDLRLIATSEGWSLFGVCGRPSVPACP